MRRVATIAFVLALGGVVARAAQSPAPPAAPSAPGAPAANVKLTIVTAPPQKNVFVFWGKKKLGVIAPKQPLILQRPRDSGPLDLIIRCDGFVTVQTRIYTFSDNKLIVKLTPLDQKNTILGYREEVPPEPDGGVPPASEAGAPPPSAPPPSVAAPPPGVAAPPPGVAAPPADPGAR